MLRRSLFIVAFLVASFSILLLLNITSPNPTGRRYSSESPRLSDGPDAERILAADLRTPNNNDPQQLQCLCSDQITGVPRDCNTCLGYFKLRSSTYRRPDFVTKAFIADSKNRQQLLVKDSDYAQLGDYATAADALHIPLYIFVRKNTDLDVEYETLASSTGGALIPYFTAPGYVDPIDRGAQLALGMSGVVMIAVQAPSFRRRSRRKPGQDPLAPTTIPVNPAPNPISHPARTLTAAEQFNEAAKRKLKP